MAPAFDIVENPVSGGINTSSNVVEFTAFTTDYNWALGFTDDIGEFTFDSSNSIVRIMINKPIISKVNIKFEGSSNPIELSAVNTVTDEWEELTYDFSGQIGNT